MTSKVHCPWRNAFTTLKSLRLYSLFKIIIIGFKMLIFLAVIILGKCQIKVINKTRKYWIPIQCPALNNSHEHSRWRHTYRTSTCTEPIRCRCVRYTAKRKIFAVSGQQRVDLGWWFCFILRSSDLNLARRNWGFCNWRRINNPHIIKSHFLLTISVDRVFFPYSMCILLS